MLHHTGHGRPHFDLMLERSGGASLRTFRVASWPIAGRTMLEELGDHRLHYLRHEGPVSGGRGEVRRVEAGTYRSFPSGTGEQTLLHMTVTEREGAPLDGGAVRMRLWREGGRWWLEPKAGDPFETEAP